MESVLSEKVLVYLEARGWYRRKMHGSEYQDGIPDHLLFSPRPHRQPFLVETKVLNQRSPHLGQLMKALRPSQRKFLCDVRGQFTGVLAFLPSATASMLWIPGDDLPQPLADLSSLKTPLDRWFITLPALALKLEALRLPC